MTRCCCGTQLLPASSSPPTIAILTQYTIAAAAASSATIHIHRHRYTTLWLAAQHSSTPLKGHQWINSQCMGVKARVVRGMKKNPTTTTVRWRVCNRAPSSRHRPRAAEHGETTSTIFFSLHVPRRGIWRQLDYQPATNHLGSAEEQEVARAKRNNKMQAQSDNGRMNDGGENVRQEERKEEA